MFNLKSILVAAGLLASIASASPANISLNRRQGIYVEDPFCEAFVDNGLTIEDLNTLRDLYVQSFGTSGELPSQNDQAVCCNGACFSIQNLAGRTISWDEAAFNEAYDAMIGEHGGSGSGYGICAAPTGDIYLVSSASRGASSAECYGDTCGGAAPYRGECNL